MGSGTRRRFLAYLWPWRLVGIAIGPFRRPSAVDRLLRNLTVCLSVFFCVVFVLATQRVEAGWLGFGANKRAKQQEASPEKTLSRPRSEATKKLENSNPSVAGKMFRITSREAADDFTVLARRDKAIREEIEVLNRIQRERTDELAALNRDLRNQFSIQTNLTYQYDANSRAIFLETNSKQPSGKTDAFKDQSPGSNSCGRTSLEYHMSLHDDELRELFVKLVMAKKLVVRDIAALQHLLALREKSLRALRRILRTNYGIRDDVDYRYDPEAMTIYEVDKSTKSTAAGKPSLQNRGQNQ